MNLAAPKALGGNDAAACADGCHDVDLVRPPECV
jgi:hypothetical protein